MALGGGRTDDRPWGRTFAGFSQTKLSGQIEVADGERTFVVAFAEGTVIGARSPLATDAAVRVARLANLISPMQVSSFVHAHGTTPIGDDVDLLIAHAKLSNEQATELRRKVIAHRAARTFSVEGGSVIVNAVASIDVIPGCELDPRGIIYQGARNNLTERRLTGELAKMGTWFRIKPDIDPAVYGFGASESALIERLRLGGSLAELEVCAPGIDIRMVRGVLYALCATDACDIRPTGPVAVSAVVPAPLATLDVPVDTAPAAPSLDEIVGLSAPPDELADLPTPRPEVVDLLAPKSSHPRDRHVEADNLLAPVSARERSDTVLDAPDRVDLVGITIDGRYVLDVKVGEGAMGAVYLSHHTKLDRLFAVKVLHRRLLGSEKARRRFERAAELTSRLTHHNVVRVVDVGVVEGLPYLAMEFVEGTSLGTLLVDAPLPSRRAFHLLRQLCAGLQHAHDAGLVHRDLKPSNVIVDASGTEELLRIVDFGIAILNEPEGAERLTTRGVVLGSPDYMAPELALGTAIDHRLDLYALGVIAYQMFSGVRPFTGDGVDIALANVNRPVPPIAERAPGVTIDPLVEALVRKLLEKSPLARPANAQAVRKLLDLIESEIESDRAAAATALGVTPAVATPSIPTRPLAVIANAPLAITAPASSPSSTASSELPAASSASPVVVPAATVASGGTATSLGMTSIPRTPGRPATESTPVSAERSPESPAGEERGPVKTRAMWKLDRDGMAPISPATATGSKRPIPIPRTGSGTTSARHHDYATDAISPMRVRAMWFIGLSVIVGIIVFVVIVVARSGGKQDEPTPPALPSPAPATPAPPATTRPETPAKPATGSATPAKPDPKPDTSTVAITTLYRAVGTELAQLQRAVGNSLTSDLTRRYRMLSLPAAVQSAPRRAAAHEVLTQLRRDIRALREPGR